MSLSNALDPTQIQHYKIDPNFAAACLFRLNSLDIFNTIEQDYITTEQITDRFSPDPAILHQIQSAWTDYSDQWLIDRGVTSGVTHTKFFNIEHQDRLNLNIIPQDHIIKEFGFRSVDGYVFPDKQDGNLLGICIRNDSDDKKWVANAKYTFSNYGLFIFGIDDLKPDTDLYICEGVFDVYAMRSIGKQAIALGSSWPTAYQLARIHSLGFKNTIACMDNDFYGRCGAYAIASCLGSEIIFPESNDPSIEIIDTKSNKFFNIDIKDLNNTILNEIPEYNIKIKRLNRNKLEQFRDLRYN